MSSGESILPGEPVLEPVLELTQLAGGVVLFADHPKHPDVAFSAPRASWDALGNPTVVTVTVTPGGDFVPKPDPEGPATTAAEQALAKLGVTGAYL